MKKIFFFVLSVLCVCIADSRAQTNAAVGADLKQLSQVLGRHRYTYRLTYTLYDSYRSLKPVETQVMDVKMWDMMVNIKNRHFQVIKNKKHYLYIDPDQKTMMLNTVDRYTQDFKQLQDLEKVLGMDTVLSLYSKVEVLKTAGESKGYRFHNKKGLEYAYSDIIFNAGTGFPERIIFYYAKGLGALTGNTEPEKNKDEPPRIEMDFSNFTETPTLNEQSFSISPFLKESGKKFVPTADYQGYTFINNTY